MWEDNFDGTSINLSNWNVAHNFTHGDKELQLYLRDDVYVASGNLVLRTRRNPTMYGRKLYNWTSGWVDTMHKAYSPFGRFEIRARLPDPKVCMLCGRVAGVVKERGNMERVKSLMCAMDGGC